MTAKKWGLGLDAGGTATRWALVARDGEITAQGKFAGVSGLQMMNPAGQAALTSLFKALAAKIPADVQLNALQVFAGVTGLAEDAAPFEQLVADALGVPSAQIRARSDIELLCRATFAPGEGYVVYAGTGSVAAFLDETETLHRAGGRGVMLDDGGGGFWIAREALRFVWRREDEAPGAWKDSHLARAIFDSLGDSSWEASREFLYGKDRGAIGSLALTVAQAAQHDSEAKAILVRAGEELARLARAMHERFGSRPTLLAGGAARLHPCLSAQLKTQLGPHFLGLNRVRSVDPAHVVAARIAVQS